MSYMASPKTGGVVRVREMIELCDAIMKEVLNQGFSDILDKSWSPDANIKITLTVKEIRFAANVMGYTGKKKEDAP